MLCAMDLVQAIDTSNYYSPGYFSGSLVFWWLILGVGLMGIFKKAGRPVWEAWVPGYELVVLCWIVGRSGWLALLVIVPCVGPLIYSILISIDLAKQFGQTQAFGLIMGIGIICWIVNFVCLLMLSFGPAEYHGPLATAGGGPAPGDGPAPGGAA
jgi:Family of unknown function (DUF5684)